MEDQIILGRYYKMHQNGIKHPPPPPRHDIVPGFQKGISMNWVNSDHKIMANIEYSAVHPQTIVLLLHFKNVIRSD